METLPVLSSLPRGVMFMWWRRVLRRFSLILLNLCLMRGLSCNQFVALRQRTKLTLSMKKITCLFWHQDKLWIQRNIILPFFVALKSKLMMKMILHPRTSLKSNSNRKGIDKKVARCVNQRALYTLARRTILRIISRFFETTCKRRCWTWVI